MKRRDILKSIGALLGIGAVARELQPESRPESTPLAFPDRPIVPTKAAVFDDSEFVPDWWGDDEPIGYPVHELATTDDDVVTSRDNGVTWTRIEPEAASKPMLLRVTRQQHYEYGINEHGKIEMRLLGETDPETAVYTPVERLDAGELTAMLWSDGTARKARG